MNSRRTPSADRLARLAAEGEHVRGELRAASDRISRLHADLLRAHRALEQTVARNETLWRIVLKLRTKR